MNNTNNNINTNNINNNFNIEHLSELIGDEVCHNVFRSTNNKRFTYFNIKTMKQTNENKRDQSSKQTETNIDESTSTSSIDTMKSDCSKVKLQDHFCA
jgi:hypothetical protein